MGKLREAGFEERVRGAVEPKYTYHPIGDGASYIEFLAHLGGSGVTRGDGPDRLFQFSGLHAEKLRHVDLLLHRPWTASDVGDGPACKVVNPLAYLLQKLLVLPNRRGSKQAKDVLYVFDTLAIFADSLESLAKQASQLVPSLKPKQAKAIRASAQRWCFEESEATRGAAVIAQSQRASARDSAQVAGACRLGSRALFGECLPGL